MRSGVIAPAPTLKRARKQDREEITEWLPGAITRFTRDGRSALVRALRSVGVGPGSKVLIPEYVCEAVVVPVRALGARTVFYPVDRRLDIDMETVRRIAQVERCDAAVAIHYFGRRSDAFGDFAEECARAGTPVVEDCAHALLSTHQGRLIGSDGAAAIFSFRKSLGVVEGGAMVASMESSRSSTLSAPAVRWSDVKGIGRESWFRMEEVVGLSLRLRLLASRERFERLEMAESSREVRWKQGMSSFARGMLDWGNLSDVKAQRRDNYLGFQEFLKDSGSPRARPLWESLPEGVCPLGFPVLVEDRDSIRDRLYRAGIGTRTMWARLPQGPEKVCEDVAFLRDHLLIFPLHRKLSAGHAKRLREVVRGR